MESPVCYSSHNIKAKGEKDARILRKMPCPERNEESQSRYYEKWEARYPGYLSYLWYKDVQDR